MGPDADGSDPIDFAPEQAFKLLGNETRMEILQALWEAYDPFVERNGLAFSDLFDRVGITDSGQFNYHLDKLRDRFVARSDDRYRLTPVGLQLVQSVIAGAGRPVDYEPTEVDAECRLCGAPIELQYDGIRVYFVCTECDGNFEDEDYPDGTLWGETMPPAGVVNRSAEELFATVSFLDWPHKAMLTANVCPECTGVLEQSIEICEDHDTASESPCSTCGYTQPVQAHWRCGVCKYHGAGTPTGYVKNHPAVIAFRYEHGIDFGYPYTTSEFEETRAEEAVRQQMVYDLAVDSTDPVRLRVTVGYDGDAIELTLDEDLSVRSVTEPAAD